MKYLYERTVAWLKRRDDINNYVEVALKDIDSYKVTNNALTKKNCSGYCVRYSVASVKGQLPNTLPYSSEFITYINNEKKYAENYLFSVISDINELNAQKKKQKAEALVQKRENEKRSREQQEETERKTIKVEVARLNTAAKSFGYSGYENKNIINLIYTTQKDGGLEKYLNKVVGCHKFNQQNCKRSYAKLKAIQILDDAVLYSYSKFVGGSIFDFSILANKEKGKIYQEGQAIKNTFYVFTGMYSYKSVLGVTKTVPVFKSVSTNL